MTRFLDEFTAYSDGELDNQGTWNKHVGSFYASDAGNYAYTPFTDVSEYYNTGVNFGIAERLYYKAVFRGTAGGIVEGGINRTGGHTPETGFRMEFLGGYNMLYKITNNTVDPYLAYQSFYGNDVTVEFVHNYLTDKFEYFACNYPSYYGENLNGTSGNYVIDEVCIMGRNTTQNRFSYIEVHDQFDVMPKYLKYPQWQKTQYGMRPCY